MITDEQIIKALIEQSNVSAAAEKLGCSRSTIYNRVQNESFKEKFYTVQSCIMETTVSKMMDSLSVVIKSLVDIVTSEKTTAKEKIDACNSYLNHFEKVLDIQGIVTHKHIDNVTTDTFSMEFNDKEVKHVDFE